MWRLACSWIGGLVVAHFTASLDWWHFGGMLIGVIIIMAAFYPKSDRRRLNG